MGTDWILSRRPLHTHSAHRRAVHDVPSQLSRSDSVILERMSRKLHLICTTQTSIAMRSFQKLKGLLTDMRAGEGASVATAFRANGV